MTLEELKEFEKTHPEYKELFKPILTEFDKIAKEEFAKAFKAIDERLKAIRQENIAKYNTPKEDAEVIGEALNGLMKQIDNDVKKNVRAQFAKYAK